MTGKKEMGIEKAAAGPEALDLRRKSRAAAFWYLLVVLTGPLVVFYFPSKFFVAGDVVATMAKIAARPAFFRLGILFDFISLLCFLMAALALYELLKKVDGGQARVMVTLVVVCVCLALTGELFKTVPLLIASGAGPLKALAPAQAQPLAALALEISDQADLFTQVFWGLWLLPLGILVIRSGFFPKFLGWLQMIACAGYVLGFIAALMALGAPGWIGSAFNVMILGELPFIFWLVIRGARPRLLPEN